VAAVLVIAAASFAAAGAAGSAAGLDWPDTFGLEASTERQRYYASLLAEDALYTPQMVIGGPGRCHGNGEISPRPRLISDRAGRRGWRDPKRHAACRPLAEPSGGATGRVGGGSDGT
jgi:Protein of unknown function (DUF1223)